MNQKKIVSNFSDRWRRKRQKMQIKIFGMRTAISGIIKALGKRRFLTTKPF